MGVFTTWSIIYSHKVKKNKIINNLIEYEKKEVKQQESKIS